MKKLIVFVSVISIFTGAFALDLAYDSRQKAEHSIVARNEVPFTSLMAKVETSIKNATSVGIFETYVPLNGFNQETISLAVEKLKSSGYDVDELSPSRHYHRHTLRISW